LTNEKRKRNSGATSKHENDSADMWSDIKGQIVKAEIGNRGHVYCGAAKQIKMV